LVNLMAFDIATSERNPQTKEPKMTIIHKNKTLFSFRKLADVFHVC